MPRSSAAWALVALLGCGPRGSTGSSVGEAGGSTADAGNAESEGPGLTSTSGPGPSDSGQADGMDSVGDSSGTPPVECEGTLVYCDNECVNTYNHPGNCGECDHRCQGVGQSKRCTDYECEPGGWPCVTPGLGAQTCDEACGLVGESCAEDAWCSGGIAMWLTDGPNDNDPQSNLETCMQLVGPNTGIDLGCGDPIPWDWEDNGRTVVGIACCCTQPP